MIYFIYKLYIVIFIFNCGKINSNGARNIVCDRVSLECSLRSFYKIRRKRFIQNMLESSKLISEKYNAKIQIDYHKYIPELKNDVALFEKYRYLIDEIVAPVYQAEDFSFYGINSKTLFFFLGVGNVSGLHTSNFCFDVNVFITKLCVFNACYADNFWVVIISDFLQVACCKFYVFFVNNCNY